MANKMLIDATHPEETRVVVLRGNRVEEFDFETAHRKQLRGNIYLAKVTRVEPSLQAAFVDYGGNRHGFLAFSEIHPDYYQIPVADRQALLEDERNHRDDEEDEERPRGGRRHGRHRHRDSRRRDSSNEVVRSDEMAADGTTPGGEHAMGDSSSEFTGGESGHDMAHDPADGSQPAGESANPPTSGEVAAEPTIEAAPLTETPHHEAPAHDELAARTEDTVAPPALEASDIPVEGAPVEGDYAHHRRSENGHAENSHSENGHSDASHADSGHGDNGHGDNGHGHDEEEEIVESVGGADAMEEVPDRSPRYRRQYKIQEVIKRRQVMLVQVVKEERGTKGAALTTYLSLAGRYCVLMPNTARGGGISRKITSSEDRRKLREIADELQVPEGMGVILRTAGAARTKAEVKRDFEYLLRMWEQVRDLTLKSTAPTLVYEEGSLAKRSIRDLYTKDIDEIIVSGDAGYRDAKDFMRMLMPSHAKNVKHYVDSQPLFTRFGIESQLDAMFSPTVQLRSGGYIVLNQTEALVAIDVNSGRATREHHIEDTALKTNCEAAEEVARQLRLRDLAGLIVIDFIDMDEKRNNRTVERRMKDALRNDRARIQVGRISHFGLLEMSRQRIRTSVLESSTEKCPACGGSGHVRSVSSVSLQLLRAIEETLIKGATHNLVVRTRPDVALYVLNHKRAHLRALEERFQLTITVNSDDDIAGPTAYSVDRGEQVMTLEQAKALATQYEAQAPRIIEEEEPEYIDDDPDAEASAESEQPGHEASGEGQPIRHDDAWSGEASRDDDDSERPEIVGGGADGEPSDDRNGGDRGGREGPGGERDGRGRRRRRRGRGRGGRDGREPGSGQFSPGQRSQPFEGGAPSPDAAPRYAGEHAEHQEQPHADMPPMEGDFDGAQQGEPHTDGEPRGNGELHNRNTQGDGEPRRRRRGRRGGRRNRRDAEGPDGSPLGSPGAGEPHDQGFAPEMADAPYAAGSEPTTSEPFVAAQPIAPPPPAAPAPTTDAPMAEAPPRRRSTVREPAPMISGDIVSSPPSRPVEPVPAPVVSSASESDDANKPRKTGWWAKRLLGKS